MVNLPFCVETPRRECIWRVNEKDRICVSSLLFQEDESIPLNEGQSVFEVIDFPNPTRKRVRIPPGHQSSTVFARFDQTRSGSHDSTALNAIA
jgi:hypothetical protein